MKFFTITADNFNNPQIPAEGIPATWMVTGLKKLSKDFPTMEDIDGFNLAFIEAPVKTATLSPEAKEYTITKGLNLVIYPTNQKIELTNNNTSRFFSANNNTMTSQEQDTIVHEPHMPKEMTAQEMLAINWLKNGRVGVSSQTMCFKLFPNVKKYYDDVNSASKDYHRPFEPDVPYDNADFNRCRLFANEVCLYPDQLEKVGKINNKWKNIIEKWDDLTALVEKGDDESLKTSYAMIKECINVPARTKKPKP